MMTQDKFKEYKELKLKCPYGRDAVVGGKRCWNCIFHHMDTETCSGSVETVRRHVLRLGLDY